MWIEIILFLLLVFAYVYRYVTGQFNFFKDLGVPFCPPTFPFGSDNAWRMMMGKEAFVELDRTACKALPGEKVLGYFVFGQPNFVINDEALAKHILVKDFDHFTGRRQVTSNDKISNAFMTNLDGAEWKHVRSMMSGVFTSGRLKGMTPHLAKVGANAQTYIDSIVGQEVEMKDLGGKITLDSIATAAFGIEENSFTNPKNTFRTMALIMIGAPGYVSKFIMVKILFIMAFPALARKLNIEFIDGKAMKFFTEIIRSSIAQREQSKVRRNDVLDLIMDELKASKNKEAAAPVKEFESEFEKDAAINTAGLNKSSADAFEFDDETLLLSNALVFFFAGFDTTSLGIAMIANKLALYPDFQEKIFDEMEEVLGDDDDNQQVVTFDQVQSLKYMDMFISETFRLQNVIVAHERLCTKDYAVPGTDIVIPKGRFVKVYTEDISSDAANFTNPLDFDPENFNPENKPNKFGLMMFGQGPRNCIGMRYALLNIKFALVYMLRRHRVVRCDKTSDRLDLDIANPSVFATGSWVKFERR